MEEPFATALAALPEEAREAALGSMSAEERAAKLFRWRVWARPSQLAPEGDWRVWLLRSGRGFGKTRTGAEWVREQVELHGKRRIALVARTAADCRDVMVEGESGLISVCPPGDTHPHYQPSKRRLAWPNGAIATMYSADKPDLLRGPQHDAAWADELATWRYPETWAMLLFGLRLGEDPRCVVTTTPRPTRLIRDLIAKATTVETKGSTYENRPNLAEGFYDDIISAYEGTRLGRQEIHGELLEDVPGALWKRSELDDDRVGADFNWRDLKRIVVSIDPAVTSGEESDETGIIMTGVDDRDPTHGYVLEDMTCRASPLAWAKRAVDAFYRWQADRIIAEVNQGGDLVKSNIHTVDRGVPVKAITSKRGKYVRAEPVASLYEQGRVHHVGMFSELEDQMCNYTPDGYEGSPDRVDALVFGLTELMVKSRPAPPPATMF